MKLSTRKILKHSHALSQLGKTFPAQTKANIIRNIQVLAPFVECYNALNQSLIQEVSPDGESDSIDQSPKLLAVWSRKRDEILKTEYDAKGLAFLNWTDLDTAGVDPVTIENLGFLVRGIPAPKDEDLIPE